jgi:hypothetical protein
MYKTCTKDNGFIDALTQEEGVGVDHLAKAAVGLQEVAVSAQSGHEEDGVYILHDGWHGVDDLGIEH